MNEVAGWRRAAGSLLAATALSAGPTGAWANSTHGAWSPPGANLPFFPVHAHLLPDGSGKVLIWPGDAGINGDAAMVFDPATSGLSTVPKAGYDLFCAGHAYLADGQLLVAGGHIQNNVGVASATRYNPASNSWSSIPNMNAGRWYPTVTTLGNGDALVVSGDIDLTAGVNTLPQVYQSATNSWRNLTGAQTQQPLYPLMFLMANGRVVDVGPSASTRVLDTSGTGQWTSLGTKPGGHREYGTAVMYADGKILSIGGGDPPTNRAEVLDLTQPSPAWRSVAPMTVARRQLNATLLPDGQVLVTGGTSGPGFNNPDTPVYSTEMWNPATETWTTMASAAVPRLYHSSATLLPDGSVLSLGGNNYYQPEIYRPPYFFKGTRPSVSSPPSAVGYGQKFTVQTAQADNIAKVTLIRISSVTHAFNMNQRMNVLPFTRATGALEITAPPDGNAAPPGHYLLFAVDTNGVPSVGSFVQLSGTISPPPPPASVTLSALSPNSALAGGRAFTLTVDGSGFLSGATVRWNGAPRTTSFVSATRLTAQIGTADIAAAGTASVTVTPPNSTTASNALAFTIAPSHRLKVVKQGSESGRGTVTSSPAGIDCGKTCDAPFAAGANVLLTATSIGNARFTGWSGACLGAANPCTVTMNSELNVQANFTRR